MKENPLHKNIMAKLSVNIIPKEGGMFRALMLGADLLLISQLEFTDLPSLLLETHCVLLLLFTSFQVAATCGFL
jgi:hypothetical protein